MKGSTKAKTPAAYLSSLPEPRRGDIKTLDTLVRRAAPSLKPCIQAGMLGYGKYRYRYASGRQGEWCKLALASQKSYISLYVCAVDKGRYVAEAYKTRLPKASIGKSCVRFKRLADVDLGVIEELVSKAAAIPGLGEA